MQALQPHVTVLPDETTRVNLNTATPEVIAAMIPEVQLSAVKSFVAQRERLPLRTLPEANTRMGLDASNQLNQALLSINTRYFWVHGVDQVRSRPVPNRNPDPPRQRRAARVDPGCMATPNLKLKRHQAVVWLPPRSAGERAFGSEALLLAHVGGEPRPTLRRASLDSLEGIKQVWLVADARDVSLLDVNLPPLSGARLRQALPERGRGVPAAGRLQCLVVAGPGRGRRQAPGRRDRPRLGRVRGRRVRAPPDAGGVAVAGAARPADGEADQWSLACCPWRAGPAHRPRQRPGLERRRGSRTIGWKRSSRFSRRGPPACRSRRS